MIATLTCPECKKKQKMKIPVDRCVQFYTCNSCNKIISRKTGCCIFCDYGNKKCPSAQT